MKTKPHVGNVTLILDKPVGHPKGYLLLGFKRRKKKSDEKRKRKKVGTNRWVPPGGGTENSDKSQKHSAQREVLQETSLFFPLKDFRKVGILKGYIGTDPLWVVHLYLVSTSKTDAVLSLNEEYVDMRWFPTAKLPFDKMLQGDKLWIPRLAKGEKLMVNLRFNEDTDQLVSSSITEVRSFN